MSKREFKLTGWHVLGCLVLFFGAVIGVDTVFTVMAVRSHPGETSATAYEDGLAYNRTLEQHAAQAALGWTATAAAVEPGVVTVRVRDADGRPLTALKLTGTLRRPATDAGSHEVVFQRDGDGGYRGEAPKVKGAWDLTFVARDAHGHVFQAERRLLWP
ncbi:FixH family protein [Caulobacter sp. 17J65-9]|uniref:FixH family protein n=1 Tax=Caulobacter sp. 17J65-9 TaxID=2709382 RepID=UPI0013CBA553|nr:FixH family protein [Caulobacter sp. 17J65-9]NEX92513.1 FixH family protein [Caulobacter sp. 17J65-9]